MKKLITAIFLLLITTQASAGQVARGKILKMMVNTVNSPMLFVRISGELSGTPSCNTNGTWQFVLPLGTEIEKNTMTSLLLSAYISGKEVRLDGNNTCDTFSSIETLTRFEFVE